MASSSPRKTTGIPVRLTDFSITEEAFDPNLNPILAKVSLGFRVLNIDDLDFDSKSGSLFMIYQQQKERLANQAVIKVMVNYWNAWVAPTHELYHRVHDHLLGPVQRIIVQ